jgi:hypothetical protein
LRITSLLSSGALEGVGTDKTRGGVGEGQLFRAMKSLIIVQPTGPHGDNCVFRRMWPTHSEGSGPPVPIDVAHPFRAKWPTYSEG